MDDLKCDIAYVLQNGDFSILQKLTSQCYNFRAEIAARIEDLTSYDHECSEKRMAASNTITDLQNNIGKLKTEIDSAKLQQKVLDKKIFNATKDEEQLIQEVDVLKERRDSLHLEMVDLQLESEKRRKRKLLTWDAIKRSCYIYSNNLDFHIHLKEVNGEDYIKVSFFIHNENYKDKFYACMSHHDNSWTVTQIHPILKKEYLKDLKDIVDTSDTFKINNVTAFLCQLRNIFKKYYINKVE